jgi:tetratricopeptide (TPR) repeat protein/DNA-binding CsgD family transcriptional regulator
VQVEASAPTNPYVGLRPYRREDRALFFGRNREISEALSGVIANRTFLLYASSGTGKTSLVNAGLVPALADEGFDVLPPVRVRGLAEATESASQSVRNVFVRNVLTQWSEADADRAKPGHAARKPLKRGHTSEVAVEGLPSEAIHRRDLAWMSLGDYLEQRDRVVDEEGPLPRVVVFDQFEELFTAQPSSWPHREDLFRQVWGALDADPYLRIAFVVREDHLAHLDPFAQLLPDGLRARFRLEGLREQAALAAITGPLRGTARTFAPDAARKLVEDLQKVRIDTGLGRSEEFRGEFVEPVQLQVVCESLWNGLPAEITEITQEQLRDFGNVDQVLARFYSEIIHHAAADSDKEERQLRSWFEGAFITAIGTRNTVYRGVDTTAGVPNKAIAVMEDQHLIRAEWRAGARWFELVHDRLIEPIRASNREFIRRPLERAAEMDPLDAANQALRAAEVARWSDLLEDAEWQARQAVDLFREIGHRPGEALALLDVGATLVERADLDAALDVCGEALAIFREVDDGIGGANALLTMGDIHAGRGQVEEALNEYGEALNLARRDGDSPIVAALLTRAGPILQQLGRIDEAKQAYQTAASLDLEQSNRADAAANLLNYGVLEQDSGNPNQAGEAYRAAVGIFEEVGDREGVVLGLSNLGSLSVDAGSYEDAVQYFSRAIDIGSRQPDSYAGRGNAYWYSGRLEEALADLDKALGLFRNDRDALLSRGQILAELGRFDEAVRDLSRVIDMEGDVLGAAYALNGLGLAKGGLGDFDGAAQAFERSLTIAPRNAWVLYNRALVAMRRGDEAGAVRDFRMALEAEEPPLSRIKRALATALITDLGSENRPAEEPSMEENQAVGEPLTATEVRVLAKIARGLTTRETAASLNLGNSAVERTLTGIYKKLGVHHRAAIVALPSPSAAES